MGTVNVSRQASGQLTVPQLHEWYEDQLEDMAREGGTDGYCGNWNSNHGMHIVAGTFTQEQAEAYAEKHLEKRGSVFAFRIGDFTKVWPLTKAQQDLRDRLAKLETESNEFEYRILERAQKQKSKTKKCGHCESSINVHKIHRPELRDLKPTASNRLDTGLSYRFGRYIVSSYFGMTDCPVCAKNLLKTDTDLKNEASLKKRLDEARNRVAASRQAFDKEQAGKPRPYWYLEGECGS